MTLPSRFMAKVMAADGGCWLWTGARAAGRYGSLKVDGRTVLAHRYAYEEVIGPVPEGLELDHLCRVTLCVNPAHLEAVTHQVNVLRGEAGAAVNARKVQCPRGHPLAGDNLGRTGVHRYCRTCKAAQRRASSERRARR